MDHVHGDVIGDLTIFDLHLAAQAAPITIELPAAVSAAAWAGAALLAVIGILAGICVWFLRREITNNDVAHTELRGDVKKLLSGDVEWVKTIRDDIRDIRRGLGHGRGADGAR